MGFVCRIRSLLAQLRGNTRRSVKIPLFVGGLLAPCPDSPNCVSSQQTDSHMISPLPSLGSRDATLAKLKIVLANEPRVNIVTWSANYAHVEFTSLIFRFVDDVEFLWDDEKHVLQVRSASRVGYSDLGANRRRVEHLRAKLLAN